MAAPSPSHNRKGAADSVTPCRNAAGNQGNHDSHDKSDKSADSPLSAITQLAISKAAFALLQHDASTPFVSDEEYISAIEALFCLRSRILDVEHRMAMESVSLGTLAGIAQHGRRKENRESTLSRSNTACVWHSEGLWQPSQQASVKA